ncbi:oleosin 1-like [Telopea speciosissima]|uniref:oleosin 1-like n=1 Tax=Telopea speciosissima TaxID=54955 RepID=UPI001CC4CB66|nr:oleosin 1-like [Telopea speciosissima]
MAEYRPQYQQGGPMSEFRSQYGLHQQQKPRSRKVVKAATAVTVGGSLLVLSGLTLAATVIGLTVATPVLVICSPVLVPAAITVFLLITGFLTSGGLAVAAVSVLSWIYKYVTGGNPPGAEQLDHASYKLSGKARDMKDRAEQYGHQHLSGGAQAS